MLVVLGATAVALSLEGCAQMDLRGEGFDDQRFSEVPMRATDPEASKRDRWGFSTKARESRTDWVSTSARCAVHVF